MFHCIRGYLEDRGDRLGQEYPAIEKVQRLPNEHRATVPSVAGSVSPRKHVHFVYVPAVLGFRGNLLLLGVPVRVEMRRQ